MSEQKPDTKNEVSAVSILQRFLLRSPLRLIIPLSYLLSARSNPLLSTSTTILIKRFELSSHLAVKCLVC